MTIINSQLGGKKPTGTKPITTNGIHDVAGYANADVQVPTTAPTYYIEKTVDANGKLINSTSLINLNGVTDLGNGVLAYAYYKISFPANTSIDLSGLTKISGEYACDSIFAYSSGLTSIDLSGLTTISGQYACQNMFIGCSGLTSIDLSSLTTVNGQYACQYMFASCSGLTSINLSGLTTISGQYACQNMFINCSGLTSIDLSGLTTISGSTICYSMFLNCTNLTIAKFNALNTISSQVSPSYGPMFNGCTKLASVELGGLIASTFANQTNQLQYLFNGSTGSQATGGCTVHFPSNFDPSDPDHTFDASTLAGYPTFGGNASYIHVAFDLPATE